VLVFDTNRRVLDEQEHKGYGGEHEEQGVDWNRETGWCSEGDSKRQD